MHCLLNFDKKKSDRMSAVDPSFFWGRFQDHVFLFVYSYILQVVNVWTDYHAFPFIS